MKDVTKYHGGNGDVKKWQLQFNTGRYCLGKNYFKVGKATLQNTDFKERSSHGLNASS